MATDIMGNEKVTYAEGAPVTFDLNGVVKGSGRVRGLSSGGLLDMWIVEVTHAEGIDKALYPWSCLVVPHTLMKPA